MSPHDVLSTAAAAGLSLPTPAWLIGSLLFSLLGFAAWRYGKVVERPRIRWLGAGLMLYSYVTGPTWLLYAIGIVLCLAVWWNRPRAD